MARSIYCLFQSQALNSWLWNSAPPQVTSLPVASLPREERNKIYYHLNEKLDLLQLLSLNWDSCSRGEDECADFLPAHLYTLRHSSPKGTWWKIMDTGSHLSWADYNAVIIKDALRGIGQEDYFWTLLELIKLREVILSQAISFFWQTLAGWTWQIPRKHTSNKQRP